MTRRCVCLSRTFIAIAAMFASIEPSNAADGGLRVGAGEKDITPPPGIPMWGYGARHDMLSQGALDPLMAKAIVIAAGDDKVALVGIDLGRGPTEEMMKTIRRQIAEKAGIRHVLITGSHTHHGPVIELTDEPGLGKDKFTAAVEYSQKLPQLLIDAILSADSNLTAAKLGVATESVTLNRNRQTKREPKITDPMLAVLRFDDEQGKPIAILVNFAAHPVMTDAKILKYSADYPAFLKNKVESELATKCVFMQGAAGDMSTNAGAGPKGPQGFGETLADHVITLSKSIKTEAPSQPSVKGMVDTFHFRTRVDLNNPIVAIAYERAFFPELSRNYAKLFANGLRVEMNTVLINGELALVGGAGEFFCNHANRLKARSYVKNTLFFGYCNGHGMYFPTIEAASEGGYGADPGVSFAELGAGERMMDKALLNIYRLQGKFAKEPPQPVERSNLDVPPSNSAASGPNEQKAANIGNASLVAPGQAGIADGFCVARFGQGVEEINGIQVKVGDPQFTLIWNSRADLDFHLKHNNDLKFFKGTLSEIGEKSKTFEFKMEAQGGAAKKETAEIR
jgi:neutral ceramidase